MINVKHNKKIMYNTLCVTWVCLGEVMTCFSVCFVFGLFLTSSFFFFWKVNVSCQRLLFLFLVSSQCNPQPIEKRHNSKHRTQHNIPKHPPPPLTTITAINISTILVVCPFHLSLALLIHWYLFCIFILVYIVNLIHSLIYFLYCLLPFCPLYGFYFCMSFMCLFVDLCLCGVCINKCNHLATCVCVLCVSINAIISLPVFVWCVYQ